MDAVLKNYDKTNEVRISNGECVNIKGAILRCVEIHQRPTRLVFEVASEQQILNFSNTNGGRIPNPPEVTAPPAPETPASEPEKSPEPQTQEQQPSGQAETQTGPQIGSAHDSEPEKNTPAEPEAPQAPDNFPTPPADDTAPGASKKPNQE